MSLFWIAFAIYWFYGLWQTLTCLFKQRKDEREEEHNIVTEIIAVLLVPIVWGPLMIVISYFKWFEENTVDKQHKD